MNSTLISVAIEFCLAFTQPNTKSLATNINKKRGINKIKFSVLLAFILTFSSLFVSAATYYIAPAGSDAANGDITHPFATLNKAWTVVASGDQVYLRGGTYTFTTQQILSGKNGTASNIIKVWAYPGEIPVLALNATSKGITLSGNYINFKGFEITGLATLSGWTNAGNGIYSKTVTCESPTNMVTVNGVNTAMGRYPNANAANSGYLTIDSHSGTSSITDAALPASPVWTGGELVVRREHWTIDREVITAHSTHTLAYSPFTGAQSWDIHEPVDGYGYFVQNDLDALDQMGEWYYDGTTMYMYFGSNNPTSYVVKTSTVNNLMSVSNSNYVTFENMTLQGGNATSFKTSSSTYTTLQNSTVNFTGGYGVYAYYTGNYNKILNNSISNSNYSAIRMEEGNSNVLISGNRITNSGVLPGMGARINLNGIFEAINTYNCSNTIVEHNRIINTGYNAIHLAGSAGIVRNNFIDTYCFLKDDGGGIYTYGTGDGVKRYIQNNIILNGIGAVPGTTENLPQASGIYSDGYTDNIEMSGNSVNNASFDGIYIHNSQRINAHNNTFYNNTRYGISIVYDGSGGSAIRNASIKNNISITKSTGQRVLEYYTYSSPTDILLFGTTDTNYFINPYDNNPVFRVREYPNGDVLKTFAQWKSYCQQDGHSNLSPTTVPDASYMRFEYNDTTVNKTIALGATYFDAKGIQYVGSITLLPYTSAVLMRTSGTSNQAPVIQNQTFQLNENSPNGTAVGTVVASDPDAGQTLTYSLLSGNTNSAFAINASTGAITVANSAALNYEIVTSFALVVKVQDNGSGTLSSQATITVTLLNVNEIPIISNQAFSLNENSANGTAVGSVVASDPDAGQTLSYSILSGNINSAFAINASTGAITVANSAALNYEVVTSFALVIKVQDNGTGNLNSQATVTINLLNINEPPVVNDQIFSIPELAANGTIVGTVVATDPDAGQSKTFSITSGNTSSAFSINSTTGSIIVATSTALNFLVNPVFNLNVRVTDNGTGNLSDDAIITINVAQSSNQPPVISNQTFAINENSPNGTSVGIVIASDPNTGQTLSYSILSGNINNAFAINSSTGALTVATSSALNYEAVTSFALVIKVQDNGSGTLSSQATITVTLLNVNELPIISNQAFSINENLANGTAVGSIIASDPDAGQTLTYSILSGNTNGAFIINSSTGVITVSNSAALNYEIVTSFALVVKVQDNGIGNLSSQATITIILNNVNEPPVVDNQVFSIQELTANGTSVGTVIATDPDAGQTKTFSITSGNTSSAFLINSTTGVITVSTSTALNFLINPVFYLNVRVTDNGTGNLFADATITINVTQSSNQPPVIANQSFTVNEHSPNGTIAGTVVATDPNAGQTLSFSILSGNTGNAFSINPNTGTLTIADSAAVNYETLASYALVVKVQDNGTGNLSSQAIATEIVLNVNETPILSDQIFNVSQQATNGSVVGTVLASDPDPGQTLTYSILSGNTNGAFAINSSSGAITVANAVALVSNTGGTNYTIFQSVTPPSSATINIGDGTAPLEVGMKFKSSVNGYISGLRFYKGTGSSGVHIGNLWSLAGINLASATFSGESASGWQTVTLSTPVAITANTIYVVSYYSQHGDYVKSDPYFTTDIVNGPLTALGWTSSQPNGVYSYSSTSAFPNNNAYIGSSNYWADVIFSQATSTGSFALIVKVQDNGVGNLSNQATMAINLLNGNQPPIINNQAFSIFENSANGTVVGTAAASDPDAGQSLAYSIISGNTNNAFTINSTTGAITVSNSSALVYQTNPVFALTVRVTDSGTGNLFDDAIITINVLQNTNLPPVISNQGFAINENSINGTIVGTVVASDPNSGQTLTYALLSGNTNGAFSINASSGVLAVANSAALNYEALPSFTLVIKVQDNGAGTLSSTATITVTIKNVNEYPIIANQSFSVNEFAVKGTLVGTVVASDPDAGQTLTYAITAGNTSTAFSINSSSGVIKVNNKSVLNYSINPIFHLTVRVKDNGTGLLASTAVITINVIDGKSAYVISITSIPQDTVSVQFPYSYEVIGYSGRGTMMHFSAETLPNWLTLTDNGNGTAMLTGIPEIGDIGSHLLVLKGSDSMLEVQQAFSIEVKPASVNGIFAHTSVGMHIYPNPVTNGILNVKLDEGINEKVELSILDLSGKLLLQKQYEPSNLITLDLSAYPPALYLIQVRSLNFFLINKFIVK